MIYIITQLAIYTTADTTDILPIGCRIVVLFLILSSITCLLLFYLQYQYLKDAKTLCMSNGCLHRKLHTLLHFVGFCAFQASVSWGSLILRYFEPRKILEKSCDSLASALRPLDYCVDAGFSAPEINGSEPRLQGMLMG